MVVNNNEAKIYKSGYMTFILTEKDIIIKTSLNQTFFLSSNYYWTSRAYKQRMDLIRAMVHLGEITCWNDLAGYTRPGIAWTPTQVVYDISKCDIKELQ